MSSLSFFVLAAIAFAVAVLFDHPASAGLLLAADALVITGIAQAIRFRLARPSLTALLHAAPLFAFTLIYAAFVEIIAGYPMWRLAQNPSLDVTLALSTALVVVVLSLWKVWPIFGIPVLIRRLTGIQVSATRNGLALALQLTNENELFFSHGLPVSLSLLVIVEGTFTISGFGFPLHGNQRFELLAIYAILIAPMAGYVIINRTANALLLNAMRERSLRGETYGDIKIIEQPIDPPAEELPAMASKAELDAMLLRCVRAGQTQLALSALSRGANPNCVPDPSDRDQRSVVELASVSPDMRLLRGLIAKGADLNRAHAGLPPLIAATRDSLEGRPDAVMTLLTNGADPRCVDRHGDTPMHCAALCEKPIMAALLGDAGAPLDAVNAEGLTPLGIACASANWDMVRFLLERGAKLETEHGQPAILAAAGVDDDDIQGVKLLIKRKARVDARGPLKRTALMAAAMNSNELIAQMLLDAGADIDLTDAHGTTALMESARASAAEVLDVFAARNPALDVVDARGRTALMIACQSVHASEDIVRRLLGMGAARDIALTDGRRAVDLAAAAGRWNIVALLDPHYPRPQNVESGVATPSTDVSADHLLDALRFGHWHVVERFGSSIRDWPSDVLAKLFVDLIRHDDAAPRRWLLVNGLSPDTYIENRSLLATVLAELPDSLAAAGDLLDAGAPIGGDLLPHIYRAPATAEQSDAVEALARRLLDAGADPFALDTSGASSLARAVAAGNISLARALIARGADPNARDSKGRTPLFSSLSLSADRAIDMIKLLIAAGANPDVTASNGETPLGLALARSEPGVQQWLNWHVWKLPQRPLRNDDVLAAAAVGDATAIGKLLSLGFSANHADAQGATPLLRAAGNGHADAVACLLRYGADATRAATSGATVLSAAVIARNAMVIDALTSHRIDIDQRLKGGGTALMIAAALGFPEIVTTLLNNGANVDASDESHTRALHAAAHFAFHGRDGERARQTLEALLNRGAAVEARNSEGQTPLLLLLGAHAEAGASADQKMLLSLMPLLLQRGADINAADNRGVTALHACSMHGLLLPARALMTAGADPQLRDMRERTPREVAHILGFIDVATELASKHVAPVSIASSRKAFHELE